MKTAVEEIFDYLETFGMIIHEDTKTKFKEKFKQQIIDAAKHGANFDKSPFANAEDYYNQTYNNNETN